MPVRRSRPIRKPPSIRLPIPLAFLQSLWAVDHGLQSLSKRMQHSIGMTGPQRLIVRILYGTPELTPGQLASVLHLHPSTLTGILRRLENQRLIARRVDPSDRRRAVVRLTAAARSSQRVRRGTIEDAVQRTLARVRPSDAAATRRLLLTLARELEAAGETRSTSQRRRAR